MIESLKIHYKVGESDSPIDPDFDEKLREFMKFYDLKFQASGVELETGIRDLEFRVDKGKTRDNTNVASTENIN